MDLNTNFAQNSCILSWVETTDEEGGTGTLKGYSQDTVLILTGSYGSESLLPTEKLVFNVDK
jgi:hypothetical protein